MKCKFCDAEVDMIGSFEHECCSWCQSEQPYHLKTCWICESPLDFGGGVALCEKCGKDYITEEGKTIIDNCYNHYLQGVCV